MNYEHTQRSPLGWILLICGISVFIFGWTHSKQILFKVISVVITLTIIMLSQCFRTLTVRDEGEGLAVRFGPLPIFRTRIPYSEMIDIQPDRSNILDGWGIHYTPGKGKIYNVWGLDCVKIQKRNNVIRIGTDDKDALVHFLKTRI